MFRGNSEKPDARSKVQPRRSLTSVQQQPRLDSADAQTVHYVLKGNVQQTLPLPRSKCIRLVLATSTYADFEAERDCLWREIVPELQQFCLNYGAELFVIDPFQSSDKDLTDDPFLLQTLLTEIDQCRQLSAGLFFICLLGDKYGASSLPIDIRVDEYNHIRTAAFEASKDVRMLDEWYKLDNNSTPPAYTLVSSGTKKKMDAKTRKALIDTVQKGAQQAHNEGLINQVSPKHQERFFCSPIELLVQAALGTNNATKNIFTVMRKFDGMKKEDNQKFPFLDEDHAGSIVKPAERIGNLKNMLTSVCDRNNTESFTVSWPDKMDLTGWLKSKERERYLDQFTHQVTYKLKQLIGNAMTEWSTITYNDLTYDNAYNEGMVHLNWAVESKSNSFVGQAKVLDKIKDLAQAAVKQKGALINIQGGDCWGKTAMLCEVAHHVRNWLTTEPVVVVRFVGLTHSTSFAHEFWKSICMQICMAYDLDTTTFQRTLRYDSMNKFVAYALEKVSASKQPLVLLIDDVHLMKYGRIFGGGCESDLLPNPLPPNIIIVCTSAIGTAQSALPWPAALTSKSTIGLNELGENDLIEIVKNIVSVRGRKLATDQLGIVKQRLSLKNKSNPFIAILLAEEATTWGSHMQPKTASPVKANEKNEKSGGGQSPSAIEARLKQLETEFGLPLLKAIGQYFCVSSHGLTELELLDSLSCNRELLRLIYADADKKTQRSDLVGFPVCTWLAIKKELGVLLKFVIYDNRRIIDWNHASTCNLVRHRYLQNTADIKKCHSDLADLFGDVWSELASTVSMGSLDSGLNTTATRPRSSKLSRVPVFPQPLKSASLPGETAVFNVRRVRNLWYHVLHAGNIDYLKEQALCNFHYLDAVVQSCGLPHLLTIFEDTLQQVLHHDLQVLCEQVILPSLPTLTKDRDQMAAEVIGRLRYTRAQNSHFLNTIVEQAMAWVDTYIKQPLLVPLTCWIRPPKLNLVFRFRLKEWQSSKTVLQPTLNHQHLLISGNTATVGAIAMYHIASQTLVRTFTGHTDRVTSITLSNNGQFFVTTSLDKSVRTWDLMHGHCIRNFSPHSERIICSLMTHDDLFVITGSADSSAKVVSLENGRIVRSFQDHTGPVCALAITSSSEFLITGSGDFVVMVWDLETGQAVSRMGGLMAPVTCMTITSNDAFLVVSCEDETLRVFSLCSGTELHELSGHEGKVHTMIAAQDDCQLFAGCADGKIYCYDVHNGEILDVLQCASDKAVTALKITNDNYFLVSGSHDWIHVWNVEQRSNDTLHLMGQMTASESPVTSVVMSRDQKYAACGTKAGVVALWDLEVCQCVWTAVQSRKEPVTELHLTQDSTRLLSGNSVGVVSVWDMANGSLIRSYEGHDAEICGIQTVADNSRVLSMDLADNLHVWMLELVEDPDIETTFTFKGPRGLIKLCPNDRDLVARLATNAKEVKIWTLGEETITPRAKIYHNEEITCMSVTSNGRLLVTGSMDQSLKVWDIETGFLTQVLVGHEDAVHCCAIADDERIVVSGAADKMVMIWEVETGDTLHTLGGHKDSTISAVGVTSDGAVAFSADKNGWVQAWDAENGRLLSCFSAHRPVLELVPSFDANRIILRLEACPQLPILCLHNTPAGLLFSQPGPNDARRRSTRTHSISSIGSNYSGSSGHGTMREQQAIGQPVASTSSETRSSPKLPNKTPGKPGPLLKAGKTFDKLERSRSRASLYGDPVSTKISTLPSDGPRPPLATAIAPRGKVQSSNVCTVL